VVARAKVIELRPKPARTRTSRRKKPDEWRAINRSHRVKDGRALILAVPNPRRPGNFIIGEGYWCRRTGAWWWANTAHGLPGCDAITDIYDMTGAMWMPMVLPPVREAA
jgi:hypothetical protein